jgi:hypothetical protein
LAIIIHNWSEPLKLEGLKIGYCAQNAFMTSIEITKDLESSDYFKSYELIKAPDFLIKIRLDFIDKKMSLSLVTGTLGTFNEAVLTIENSIVKDGESSRETRWYITCGVLE